MTPPSPGERVAALLTGAWRAHPPRDLAAPEWLPAVLPLLLETGSAGLAWWKLRECREPAAEPLRAAYRLHAVRAALHEERLAECARLFRRSALRPLLIKGWAAARLYPEPALRPYGDLDFVLPAAECAPARECLRQVEDECVVDVHPPGEGAVRFLDEPGLEAIRERAESVSIRGEAFRIPRPEDHLRILAVHALGHGAWRPIWLCDLAAALEGQAGPLDWELCLQDPEPVRNWVLTALRLAVEVLGADASGTPVEGRSVPRWAVRAVLAQWSRGPGPSARGYLRSADLWRSRDPLRILGELRSRWPSPLCAAVQRGAPVAGRRPVPQQAAVACSRLPGVLRRWRRPGAE